LFAGGDPGEEQLDSTINFFHQSFYSFNKNIQIIFSRPSEIFILFGDISRRG
jgi:hypothetical protein